MNYLSAENLAKSFDERQLFEKLTFGIDQGRKVALVGVNGCGKSTLLKIIAGFETQDQGEVSFRKDIKVAMLAQTPVLEDEDTVEESIFEGEDAVLKLIKDYELALQKLESDPENAPDLTPIIEQMDAKGAWDYESDVKQILGKLGIHDFGQKLGAMSGGQRKRVALAKVLVTQPDFLILDEPTNHLDLEIIEWLENYLATQNLTLLMVTHDRYFLDRVTNEILEIDQGQIFKYTGNYSYFLQKKEERQTMEQVTITKARNLMKKELEWMRRQPKARGTKAKYRIDAFHDLKETVSKKVDSAELEVKLKANRQGKKILELQKITKSFDGQPFVDQFEYVFKRGDRIGIVGPNGVGKSTFLKLIAGDFPPDEGELDQGLNTKIGFYTQEEQSFDLSKRVIDIVQEVAEYIKLADGSEVTASQLLHQFLFSPELQYSLVGKLSGGERRRLQLLRVLMENPNFIILDEPTNDLDIMTLNVLEDYLEKYDGCLLIVSHDRYFMDRLVDHLFVFEGQGLIRDFPGNYTDYRESIAQEKKAESKKETPKKEAAKPKEQTRKLSFKEKKELEELEAKIAKLESEKSQLVEQMNSGSGGFEELQQWSERVTAIDEELEEKEMRWLELSEMA
ncbi:MAG: ABC-F family ATP-binding cassette domain-containing protein [Cytophagales bacterium]|nr:ABC-F family ATP-binding cassette domain-containing protein [Cytophagales bacterium]